MHDAQRDDKIVTKTGRVFP